MWLFVIVVHLSMLLPVYGESIFDALVWKFKGMGKDKPISTYVVRPILFIIGGFIAWKFSDKELWRIAVVMVTAFLAWFPLLINLILKRFFSADIKMSHLGNNWWDRLMKKTLKIGLFRIWFFIWLYLTALCIFYYYELSLMASGYFE